MKQENTQKTLPLLTLAVIVALGFVCGAGAYTFWYANGFSYLSDKSEACNNCHVMNEVYKDWSTGSHKNAATCNDCHVPTDFAQKWLTKASSGVGHAYAFTFKELPTVFSATETSKHNVQNNCIRCHTQLVSNVVNPTTNMIHDYNKSLSCISCHKNAGHIRNF